MLSIIRTHSTDPHFVSLVKELNELLAVVDGEMHDYYHQFNSIENLPFVLVAYLDDKPVACGAIKKYNDTTVEIKRMFTAPEARGKGVGKAILAALEDWARELKFETLLLETGITFEAAINLYKKYGFVPIPNYDQYAGVKTSLCFEKPIQ